MLPADYPNPPLVNSLSYGMTETHVNEYLGAGCVAVGLFIFLLYVYSYVCRNSARRDTFVKAEGNTYVISAVL